jgi:hypothetical protein
MNKITKQVIRDLDKTYRTSQRSIVFHYGECSIKKGPRGGLKLTVERWRINGKCKTWKTRPEAFETPIKNGFGNHRGHYGHINDLNADNFHLANDCAVESEYNDLVQAKHNKDMQTESEEASD